ncbi:MAG: hypothetical protein AAFU67_17000, partial [Bacteroidota bacterium]
EISHHRNHDTSKILWISISILLLLYYFTASMLINLVFLPVPDNGGKWIGHLVASAILILLIIFSLTVLYIRTSYKGARDRWSQYEAILVVSISVAAGLFGSWLGYKNGVYVEPFASVSPSPEVRRQTTQFWGTVIVSCSLLMIFVLRSVCHRMEYLADLEAAESDWESHKRFWELQASPKIDEKAEGPLASLFNRFVHPTNCQRYAALTGNLHASGSSLLAYSFVWSAVSCILLLRALTNGRSTFGERSLKMTNDLGLFGLVIVFLIMGYGIHSITRLHGRTINPKVLSIFAGYMTGTILAFASVYLFERSAFNLGHFRSGGTSDFLLLSAISFFPLLLVTCLTANFANLGKFSAMVLVFACLFASTIVAAGTLTDDLRVPTALAFAIMLSFLTATLASAILLIRLTIFTFRSIKKALMG